MKVKWDESLKLGIEELDQQRKELFKEINKFFEDLELNVDSNLINNEENREQVDDLFYFLTDYFVTHFQLEEKFHRQYNPAGYQEHQKLHQELIDTVNELKYEYFDTEDEDKINKDLLLSIRGQVLIFWKKHIREEDMVIKQV
ncbi:bacteriohemerythrin [Fuchsiella alkaliacetigena]|uniref:bacteriohemerythrin n=1 Tax=Fuchsiella alkaliacetigena TaxID=957042 RepID=UPI00200AF1A7|nr:hemerythrin domain-containing protein [Fuchsiella alkaliacetigena]MCK8824645.1 hemerythrin domain-containing protein [Fuchsiella alkaliacetigena]